MTNQTILVTGGTGFLGSHIVKRLIDEKFNVIAVKRSTSDCSRLQSVSRQVTFYDLDYLDSLTRIFQENAVDIIIHCATNYGRSSVPPTEIIKANILLPLELLQLAKTYQVKSFINTDTFLDRKVSNYSLSKKQFLEWLTLYSKELTCINIALEHFYGPFDGSSKFISKVILDLLKNVDSIDLTQGEQKRDFTYIDDVVNAFVKLVEFSNKTSKGLHYCELGTGQTIEIRELVELIKKLTGNNITKLNFGAIPYRENEVMESHIDNSMLLSLLWQPQVSLVEGLKHTINMERNFLGL